MLGDRQVWLSNIDKPSLWRAAVQRAHDVSEKPRQAATSASLEKDIWPGDQSHRPASGVASAPMHEVFI